MIAPRTARAPVCFELTRLSLRSRLPKQLLAGAIVLASLLATNRSLATIEDCEKLGAALTEHSCFHAKFGPFDTVEAVSGITPLAPNVDSAHTLYRVVLADSDRPNFVSYTPTRGGQWVVFSASEIPLTVEDSSGEMIPIVRTDRKTTDCEALPLARSFEFTADEQYQFAFGPHDSREVILVLEYAPDFLVAQTRDHDGDGYGDANESRKASVCAPNEGWAASSGDCDDTDRDIHPGAVETCDQVDRNCNGLPDDVGLSCRNGAGSCETTGTITCAAQDGAPAMCQAAEGEATDEVCNGLDDNCDGLIDEDDDLCSETARPTCVRHESSSFCGCLVDAHCGSATSGRVCDQENRTCRAGCRSSPGGNGCSSEQVCEESDDKDGGQQDSTGQCVERDPIDDDNGPALKPVVDEPTEEAPDDSAAGGCSCRIPGTPGRSGRAAPFALLALALVIRRWRWLAAAALTFGCGGRAVDEGRPEGAEPGVRCGLMLRVAPIRHACSHGENGSLKSVVASSLSAAKAPPTDAVHVPYSVEMLGAQGGWVLYGAKREGEHVVFLGGADDIQLRVERVDPDGLVEQETTEVRMAAKCPVYDQALSVDFADGESYRLVLEREETSRIERPINVYVEYLGAFSGETLVELCE